ncbi:hypothetical protein [Paenibacillus peoriae]|uniref:hypothetical protein n=1 Tax=Paenibacillus peoriae TaxID=59893 RepID=UPI00215A7CFA|nr:hypothetical protein [Paenibacillus peoriae]
MNLTSSDWISIFNIITTAALTFFVLRATKQSANAADKTVALTEESIKLSKQINELQQQQSASYRNSLRLQYVDILYKKTAKILDALGTTDAIVVYRAITELKDSYRHGLSPENLANCFTEGEVHHINDAWSVFNDYLDNYYQSSYTGHGMGILVEKADGPIIAFEGIKLMLQDIKRQEQRGKFY